MESKNVNSEGNFNILDYGKDRDYWVKRFSGDLPRCVVPYDRDPREEVPKRDGRLSFTIPEGTNRQLLELCNRQDRRLFVVLTAALFLVMDRITGNDDCIVGIPIYRQEPGNRLINTCLPLRYRVNETQAVRSFLLETRETIRQAVEHQNYALDTLLFQLGLPGGNGSCPILDMTVLLENIHEKSYIDAIEHRSSVCFHRRDDMVGGIIEFDSRCYDMETMRRLATYLTQALEHISGSLDRRVGDLDILTELEFTLLLKDYNDTRTDYPRQSSIDELFAEQAERFPHLVAVMHEGLTLTYNELHRRSNLLAAVLAHSGIAAGEVVGMLAEHTPETIIGLLGILKAGGAYLPIDPLSPEDRIRELIRDANIRAVVTHEAEIAWLNRSFDQCESFDVSVGLSKREIAVYHAGENPGSERFSFDPPGGGEAGLPVPDSANDALSTAYVMYTSGSTGKPKGVMVSHRNVVRLVKETNYIVFKEGERILQTGALAFDASTFEIWGSLLNGLCLCLAPKDDVLDPRQLKEIIRNRHVTTIWMTSPLFNQMLDEDEEIFAGLRNLLVGGDVLSPPHIQRVRRRFPRLAVINGYGPTENTTFSTTYKIEGDFSGSVPIGAPIANSLVYILDRRGRLLPPGVAGELCVGGDGVAKGYLNDPELTYKKFIPDPFEPGSHYYRTGDMGRWLPDGTVEFIGRVDNQVKIRGYRIEPGEIESKLSLHDDIKEAAVLPWRDAAGDKTLCAYFVARTQLDTVALKEFLSFHLHDFMIPAFFVQLEKFPLNANGKIDRGRLPEPQVTSEASYAPPRHWTDRKLQEIWGEVLKLEKRVIGIDDSFFDLGGHSLKATVLVSRIHKEFDVKVPLAAIFKEPTIRRLSGFIAASGRDIYQGIQPLEKREYYPQTSAQKRMFILDQFENISQSYNIPVVYRGEGELDLPRWKHALRALTARHETLRTSFAFVGQEPVQKVAPHVDISIEWYHPNPGTWIDERQSPEGQMPPPAGDEDIQIMIDRFVRPFDLAKAPLLRAGFALLPNERWLFIYDIHHIVSDGTSLAVFIEELARLYNGDDLDPLKVQYRDFSLWQNSITPRIRRQVDYWLGQFDGVIPKLDLPLDFPRPDIQGHDGESYRFSLEPELANHFSRLGDRYGTTLYMNLLAVLNLVFFKYTGQEDIVLGTGVMGRPHADLHHIIGMFINMLAMRNSPRGDLPFNEFLSEVKGRCIKAFENQDVQFEALVDQLKLERDPSRNPLFDVVMVVQNYRRPDIAMRGLRLQPVDCESVSAKFDLTIFVEESDGRVHFQLEYCTRLFKRGTILRFARHLRNVIRQVAESDLLLLDETELMDEEETFRVIQEFNQTRTDYPAHKTISQLFGETVARFPDRAAISGVALDAGDRGDWIQLTYSELFLRVELLAVVLGNKGVRSDSLVAVCLPRSIDMMIAILAILRAGGAYLPLDPDFPVERTGFMLRDSGVSQVLGHSSRPFELHGDIPAEVFNLDECSDVFRVRNSMTHGDAGDLAYVIYTSGTTGKPKGTLITHANVIRIARNTNYIDIGEGDRLLQLSNYAFDGSVFDIFAAFLNGAALVLAKQSEAQSASHIAAALKKEAVSVFLVTTALFNVLADYEIDCLDCVRKILFGGEKVSATHVRKVLGRLGKGRLIHMYGPTESAVYATYYPVDEVDGRSGTIPIGKPISNTTVYILDRRLRPAPVGVFGEVYIGGKGLGRGYLNNPDLTAEKFIPHPFAGGDIVYKTGDLARFLEEGDVEFLGRVDSQVKIRGFRIELQEIESLLLNREDISAVVVVDRKRDDGDCYLCAYFVSAVPVPAQELREYLGMKLPDCMIPAYFMQLESLPLNTSNKVDRKALPEPRIDILDSPADPPRSELECRLAAMWSEVLAVSPESIGMDSNFFHLGGHSLKATIMLAMVHKELSVKIPLAEIFETQTLRALSRYIAAQVTEIHDTIPPAPQQEFYRQSSAQVRLFLLDHLEHIGTTYNAPFVFAVEGRIDRRQLNLALQAMIRRHESLRTSFLMKDNLPVQRIHEEVGFYLHEIEIGEAKLTDDEIKRLASTFIRPFDLSQPPLLRAAVGVIRGEDRLLFLDMHHIVTDGTSVGIFLDDFMKLYRGESLPPLIVQYKDFAEWEHRRKETGGDSGQEKFWMEQFAGEVPVLDLPTDFPRPRQQTFSGNWLTVSLGMDLARRLKEFALERDATLFMVLLAVLNVLLSKIGGEEDVVVGSPIAARQHADLQPLIGMFVNTLALRNFPEAPKRFDDFLAEVKVRCLQAFENQEYQFEDLVQRVVAGRDAGRNPLFDVMMVLQNMNIPDVVLPEAALRMVDIINPISQFDLVFSIDTFGDTLNVHIAYCIQLFKEETIRRFASYFERILRQVTERPDVSLADIRLLNDEEKQAFLSHASGACDQRFSGVTLGELLEQGMGRQEEAVALSFNDQRLTYGDVARRSNQLARYLRLKGVTSGHFVGLMKDRSFEMIIALLAIIKSGGAYLAMDPTYPPQRLRFTLENSGATLLLTSSEELREVKLGLDGLDVETILLEQVGAQVAALPDDGLQPVNDCDDLLYILYTSGSTGVPKGIMMEHRNLVNILMFGIHHAGLDFRRILQFTSLCFDVSYQEIYSTFITGGRLTLIDNAVRSDIPELLRLVERHGITTLFLPASYLKFVLNNPEYHRLLPAGISHLVTAGEQLIVTAPLRRYLKENGIFLHNHFGPSEAHVVCTLTINPIDQIPELPPVGKPVMNSDIYLLDAGGNPVPPGVKGEVYVGGAQVARGYAGRPDLTETSFISNPFKPGVRLYRTGDLGRWLPDGNLEFLGRIDFQVKIRGYRIELGEIENQLLQYPDVSDATVIDREREDGEKYLCAYFVSHRTVDQAELRRYLGRSLPEYMVPAGFVQMKEIPLNANRKVDRRALPEPELKREIIRTPPENDTQRNLASIWGEVLNIPMAGIDIDANFFESGGHSLKATILASRIARDFGVEFPLNKVFSMPTVRLLAEAVSEAAQQEFRAIPVAEERAYYPQSSPQKRLFLLGQLETVGTGYNVPAVFELKGELDIQRLEGALGLLSRRHDALRTCFELKDGEPVQRVARQVEFSLERLFLTPKDDLDTAIRLFVRPFDLSRPPLFRAAVAEGGRCGDLLLFDFHHIIIDGTSIGTFLSDFMALYSDEELPPLPIQYKDYTLWLERSEQQDAYLRQEEYWLAQYVDEVPALSLPADFSRPGQQSFAGDWLSLPFPGPLCRRMREAALREDVTLFMLLEASLSVLLSKLSGQEDIVLGTPVAARRHADLQPVIGMFVNTLALRHRPDSGKHFSGFLLEVKNHCLDAFANQEYQFDHLVEKVATRRDPSRNPLFDVMLVMQNMQVPRLRLPGLELKPVDAVNPISQFDLVFSGEEADGRFTLTACYCTALFKEDTVRRFISYWQAILEEVVDDPAAVLGHIQILGQEEREAILALSAGPEFENEPGLSVHELFHLNCQRLDGEIALAHHHQTMSYGQLKEKSARLAHWLRGVGVDSGDVVALLMQRSFDMVCAMIAILEAGAAYMPIDPEYPRERIDFMFSDSKARYLVTSEEVAASFDHFCGADGIDIVIIDAIEEELAKLPALEPPNLNTGTDPLYVIYTSGSTGKPKGVVLEHRNLVNLLLFQRRFTNIDFSCVLQFTTICFDVSFQEIFSTLTAGGRLVLIDAQTRNEVTALFHVIEANDVKTLFLPTSYLKFVFGGNDYRSLLPRNVRHIVVAGEQLTVSPQLRRYLSRREIFLHNHYGPSETHVVTTLTIDPNSQIPDVPSIGWPVANTAVYILDSAMNVAPTKVSGELYIGGIQVGKGYLGRQDLTEEKFLPNPFCEGDRLYRTGDLARYLPDGSIEFLGRKDFQVKIRGYRVEPGEVENCLVGFCGVAEAVVVDRPSSGGQRSLAAFVVGGDRQDPRELRRRLKELLPEYMVPASIQVVEKIPKLPNGKVDRRALPRFEDQRQEGYDYRHPRNAMEARIAEIWREILGAGRVGIDDNLFEIGGNSLMAMKIVTRMAGEFEVSFNQLFSHQTVAELARHVTVKKDNLAGKLRELRRQFESPSGAGGQATEDSLLDARLEYEKRAAAESWQLSFDPDKYGAILLTGGTGYLGAHLAARLVEITGSRIFLLAREKEGIGALRRFRDKMEFYFGEAFYRRYESRFSVIAGDVADERFGLNEQVYDELSREVGAIIHAAANVRHYGVYDDFFRANVLGTKRVMDFAATGAPKDVHHISTTGVGMAALNGDGTGVFSEYCRRLSPNHVNVYIRSKVEAENLVLDFRRGGGNAVIYRVGNLVGESGSGRFQENIHENAFYAYLKDAVALGLLPENGETVDLTYVDEAAGAIVRLCFACPLRNEIFHIENHRRLTFSQLAELLRRASVPVRAVPVDVFLDRLLELLDEGDNRRFPHRLLVHSGFLDDGQHSGGAGIVVSLRTRNILGALGFEWPGVTEHHVRNMMEYLRQVGFFENGSLEPGGER